MLLAAAAMVLSLVEVVVRLFVRWVLGVGGVGFIVHLLSRVLSRLSSWGDVFSRQNLVLQNEKRVRCEMSLVLQNEACMVPLATSR
jgi:hypothetical protein